ncbi:RNA polymerase II C-terminal domain kinase beta subunit [Elasticomyces elasticus]|nr:RNA polymerase II C-terminal domain kinase beta subunit [Elasticomyces elasticus]
MVYVDWEAVGICKYVMLGGNNSCTRTSCKWTHPPENEIKRLWDDPAARWPYVMAWRRHGATYDNKPMQSVAPQPVQAFGDGDAAQDTAVKGQKPRAEAALIKGPTGDDEGQSSPSLPLVSAAERLRTILEASSNVKLPRTNTPLLSLERHTELSNEQNSTIMGGNANREPLGRPNRLFAPPALPTPDNSSSPFPNAGVRIVWRRLDGAQQPPSHQQTMKEMDSSPLRQPGGFWAAKREVQLESQTSDVEAEVQASADVRPGLPLPEVTRTSAKTMLPPPPPPPLPADCIVTGTPEQLVYLRKKLDEMGATKRMSNGEAKVIGPHPSTIRVAARYASEAAIENLLHPPAVLDVQERSLAEAREDSVRLQGVTWIDNTRRALQLPIRTYTTACAYYHYFRVAHPGALDYSWADAAAAALLVSCKAEDTLKKSRDILVAAHNLKAGSYDALGSDDPLFEAPSRVVIGLERLMLESSAFDFRSKYPHKLLIKICKSLPDSEEKKQIGSIAWTVITDMHRTFAPLKQTTATMAVAGLEMAAHLQASASGTGSEVVREQVKVLDIGKWSTTREEVMETLLDLLDLYTHHTTNTILGTKYSLDDFLRIRLALNKECNDQNILRFTVAPERVINNIQQGATLRVANGHPTPVSPPQPGTLTADVQQSANGMLPYPPMPEGGGTLRFMLNPQLAAEEKTEVQKYYTEEWEEYDEVIEVPLPASARPPKARSPSIDHHSNHGSSRGNTRERDRTDRQPPRPTRERERERDRERERTRDRDLSRHSSVDDRRPPPADDRRSVDHKRSREDLRERDRDRDRDRERDRPRNRDRDRERSRDRDYERERPRARDRDRDYDREKRYDDRRYDERDRYDRNDRNDRSDRNDRNDRSDRSDRRSYDEYDNRRRERR